MTKAKRPSRDEVLETLEMRGSKLWCKSYVSECGRYHYAKPARRKLPDTDGYFRSTFRGRVVSYHVLLWIFINGDIPEGFQVDHIDGDRQNNSIDNLRLVTSRENQQNMKVHRNGKLCGCSYVKRLDKWQPKISIKGVGVYLGNYDTELTAHEIYNNACSLIEFYVNPKSFRDLVKAKLDDFTPQACVQLPAHAAWKKLVGGVGVVTPAEGRVC